MASGNCLSLRIGQHATLLRVSRSRIRQNFDLAAVLGSLTIFNTRNSARFQHQNPVAALHIAVGTK
jgi:hypothetical protein